MKKYLLLLIAVMLVNISRAADGDIIEYEGLKYNVISEADHTVEVASRNSGSGNLIIPSYILNNDTRYTVTSIGYKAFQFEYRITSVNIPKTVTMIDDYAFSFCSGLNEFIVEEGNEYFCADDGALYNYDKSQLIICPCARTDYKFPDSVTSVRSYAFYGCQYLTSITIPETITTIDDLVFCECYALTEFVVEEGNKNFCSEDGVLFNYDKTQLIQCPQTKTEYVVPDSVTSINNGAFANCRGLSSITIPNSVINIGASAFVNCHELHSITLPDSVVTIGIYAFANCNLRSITIPNSVTTIEAYTFFSTHSLQSIIIPASVTSIGECAFFDSFVLKIIDLNPNPQSLGRDVFHNFGLEVYVPQGTLSAYKEATGWSKFSNIHEMGSLDVTLNTSILELSIGKSAELTESITKDDDITVKKSEWTSSNPAVATVENGLVSAITQGSAVITYTVFDNYGVAHTVSCNVTVTDQNVYVNEILDETSVDVYTLQGIRILRNAAASDISTLPSGLYIVNRNNTVKKIVVK